MAGFMYAISDGHGAVKVGYTKKCVADRIKALQTGNPNELELVAWFRYDRAQDALALESEVHKNLNELRLCGEWFNASQKRIERAIYGGVIKNSRKGRPLHTDEWWSDGSHE